MLAAFAFVVMFHPDGRLATGAAALVLLALIYGISRHRRIAPPREEPAPQAAS